MLQNKDRTSYISTYDHINQLMEVGKVPSWVLKENGDLIRDTLSAIYELIPENLLPQKIAEAFKLRKLKFER